MTKPKTHVQEQTTYIGWGFLRYRSVCGLNYHRRKLPDNFTYHPDKSDCDGCRLARILKEMSCEWGRKHKRTSWLIPYRRTTVRQMKRALNRRFGKFAARRSKK